LPLERFQKAIRFGRADLFRQNRVREVRAFDHDQCGTPEAIEYARTGHLQADGAAMDKASSNFLFNPGASRMEIPPVTTPALGASTQVAGSPFSPFRHRSFTVVGTATVAATISAWMYLAASGWLMTSLDPDPLMVSLVQSAASLPLFVFAVPAGALADIVDKRQFLVVIEGAATAIFAIFALLVALGLVTPGMLLLFTFLIAASGAFAAPAWQSIVPQLVSKEDLPAAVAAYSLGINTSRAIGSALGGVITAALGTAAPFCIDALGGLGILSALLWWRSPQRALAHLPAERFTSALSAAFRHAINNSDLGATLMRAVGFFLFGSAYWALLPLVARRQIAGGPELYGILLGAIGAGGLGGALALPWLKAKLGPDRLVAAGTLGTMIALTLFALAHDAVSALAASLIAGISWIAVLSTLSVSAQVALPEWVRGRGLAMFVTVSYGAMAVGSLIWGEMAATAGLTATHLIAAAGAIVAIPVTWRWKLQTGLSVDLSPSMDWCDWCAPMTTHAIAYDRGPVLVSVEYRIDPRNRRAFLATIERLARERRRDGAYGWGVFEDTAEEGRYVETFHVASWLEYLRRHERLTMADRELQNAVAQFHRHGTPKVTHLISAEPGRADAQQENGDERLTSLQRIPGPNPPPRARED
jgi:MFS family permease